MMEDLQAGETLEATRTMNSRTIGESQSTQESVAPANIPGSILKEIHYLWDTLASASACDSEQTLLDLLQEIARLPNAQNAWWISTVRIGESQNKGDGVSFPQ